MNWPHRSKVWVLSATAVALLATATLAWNYSKERRLYRELEAYRTSVDTGFPKPGLVTRLTPDSVPLLLKWMQQTNISVHWKQALARRLGAISPSLAARFEDDKSRHTPSPPEIALAGFELLGSNASAAIPRLKRMGMDSPPEGNAILAMLAIGEASFPIAMEFCESSKPVLRRNGAFMLRILRMYPEISVREMLKLIHEKDPNLRREAFSTLAEFPCPESEAALIAELNGADIENVSNAAFALNTGSSNALLQLLTRAESTTNKTVRAAVLASLSVREAVQNLDEPPPRYRNYIPGRTLFNSKALAMQWRMYANTLDSGIFHSIRSNITAGLPSGVDDALKFPKWKERAPLIDRLGTEQR